MVGVMSFDIVPCTSLMWRLYFFCASATHFPMFASSEDVPYCWWSMTWSQFLMMAW